MKKNILIALSLFLSSLGIQQHASISRSIPDGITCQLTSTSLFKKPLTWILAPAIIGPILYYKFTKNPHDKIVNIDRKAWHSVRLKYEKEFRELENKYFEEFLQLIGGKKSYKKCTLLIQSIANNHNRLKEFPEFVKTHEANKFPETLKQKITSVLIEQGINPAECKLVYSFDRHHSMSCLVAGKTKFILVPDRDAKLPPNQFMAALLHEIQHIKDFDDIKIFCMKKFTIFPEFSESANKMKYEKFRTKFAQYFEKKADIMAGLENPAYAIALSDYFNNTVERCLECILFKLVGENPLNHPFRKDRIAYLRKLHDEMQEAIKEYEKQNR